MGRGAWYNLVISITSGLVWRIYGERGMEEPHNLVMVITSVVEVRFVPILLFHWVMNTTNLT
jgi:hypothetical protein